jgi:2-polyprenyl-3-methyl-5-hydroxy-6-metoxy-1,4-benzoquinol methylase
MNIHLNEQHGQLQHNNKDWWESNPMAYNWEKQLSAQPGTSAFFAEIDERFFRSSAHFGHPNYPIDPPFCKQIDYAHLTGKRVLEIGCGMGSIAAALAKGGANLTAIDITTTAIDITKRRFKTLGLQGDIRQLDAEQLDFADNTFDMVWSWGVIHHSANMAGIIQQIHRVLKSGGQAKIMIYHRHALRNWILAGLYEGVFKAKFLTTPYEEILRSVTDGYIARHLTRAQARQAFAAFANVTTELTCLQDLSYLPGNVQFDRYITGKLFPTRWKRAFDYWLMQHFGWFIYLEATK